MTVVKFIILCIFVALMVASLYEITHFDVDDEEDMDENMYDEEVDDYE